MVSILTLLKIASSKQTLWLSLQDLVNQSYKILVPSIFEEAGVRILIFKFIKTQEIPINGQLNPQDASYYFMGLVDID